MQAFFAAIFGLIFGFGLIISGMTDPDKILAFLDFAEAWDATLAFVMAGALAVAAPAFAIARRRPKALLGGAIALPDRKRAVDAPLIAGAAIFGVGWGLSGFCPGPALVLLSTFEIKAGVFFAALLAGIWIAAALSGRKSREFKVNLKEV